MSVNHQQEQSCVSQQAIQGSRGTNIPKQEDDPEIDCLPRRSWSWSTAVEHHQHEVQALVIDYESKTALLRREGQRRVLPGFWVYHEHYEQIEEPTTMISHVAKLIGTAGALVVLRPLWVKEIEVRINDEICTLEKCVMLVEAMRDVGRHGCEYEWVKLQEADVYHLFEDAAKAIREEIQWALKGSQPANVPAWQRPGWLRFAVSWMEDVLDTHCNVRLTEPVFVQRSSANGVILRAKTRKGRFFLKCTSPLANDAAYTDALGEIVPRFVSRPVALDRSKQMMVTADYGAIVAIGRLSTDEEKDISSDYARLQKGTIGRTDELVEAGFPDLRPIKLLEYIDKLAIDPMFHRIGNTEEYGPYVKFFCENRERLKADLRQLIESSIPATITHNDLGVTNIYKPVDTDHYMFFDWVEGFVGHPFTSSLHGIETEAFLEEWKLDCNLGIAELRKLLDLGSCFHRLAILILRLREARLSEPHHANKCLEEASSSLRGFKLGFVHLQRDVVE